MAVEKGGKDGWKIERCYMMSDVVEQTKPLLHAKQDKESQRKRNLFDGFRSSARNLFLAFIFLHAYTSAGEGELGSLIQTQMAKLPVRCVVYGAMLLMLIRYWHYSYLKFKYCYEDNVFERNRTQDAVTESAASK